MIAFQSNNDALTYAERFAWGPFSCFITTVITGRHTVGKTWWAMRAAMPWKRAKKLNAEGPPHKFIELFQACFRIAEEAGLPLIVENVKGAQPWVGKAKANYGSFYLWGDVETVNGRIACGRDVMAGNLKFGMPTIVAPLPDGTGKLGPADGKQGGSGAAWFDKALDERRKAATAGVKVGGDWFGKTYAEQKAAGDISPMRRHRTRHVRPLRRVFPTPGGNGQPG